MGKKITQIFKSQQSEGSNWDLVVRIRIRIKIIIFILIIFILKDELSNFYGIIFLSVL